MKTGYFALLAERLNVVVEKHRDRIESRGTPASFWSLDRHWFAAVAEAFTGTKHDRKFLAEPAVQRYLLAVGVPSCGQEERPGEWYVI